MQIDQNIKLNQDKLPPITIGKASHTKNLSDQIHILPSADKTGVSWMDQSSFNDTFQMNKTQFNNSQYNFQVNKSLLMNNDSFSTPHNVMKKLGKNISPEIWTTQSAGYFKAQEKTHQEIEEDKMEGKFLNKLNESFEQQVEDKEVKEIVGEKSENLYYKHYKKLKKVEQQNLFYKDIQESAFTSMLKVSEQKKLIPCKLGLIRPDGNEEIIEIDNRKIGNQYAQVLSEGLKKVPQITQFHLRNNRITQLGSEVLLARISKQAKFLDLSYNEIGRLGCERLSISLSPKIGRIQHLNLEGNKLGDTSANIILESIINNKTLQYLNMSENFLSDKVKDNLQQIILEHQSLEELYLRWNNFKGPGGRAIFEALTENHQGPIKVIDISSNNLGSNGGCEEQIAEFFQKNEEVIHIDLSYNHFNLQQSRIIGEGLKNNKTIYGIHFLGNKGYIDSRGFWIENIENNYEQQCELTRKQIKGCETVVNKMFRHHRDQDLKDCCWICEGWQEYTFTWTQDESGVGDTDPLFIHFNFENFQPCYYGKQSGKTLTYSRMVPPGQLDYFFTTGTGDEQTYAKDHPNTKVVFPEHFKRITLPDNETRDVEIENYNTQKVDRFQVIQDFQPQIKIKPRTLDPKYIPEKKRKTKKRWTFPISVMYKWKPDTEQLLSKCFEFDWEHSRVSKVIKNEEELEKTKQFFKERYQYFKNAYKHYACINPVGEIWAIQTAGFFEIINQIGIIDGKLVKDADMNIKWTSVISSGEKGNPRNPVQAVNRHQFMEVWVRVSEEKYIFKYKTTTSHFEAVKSIWEEHLEPLFTQFNQQKWREERYWNEQCDYCIKHYKKIIEYVYKQNSKKNVKPGQVPFMCLDELQHIINQCNLGQEENFGSGVYLTAFNESMMTQVDEIGQDRIFQMSMVEFYEALARIAEEASLIPMLGEFGIHNDSESDWPLERRKNQILGHKIEALIIRMYDCCTDTAFKLNNAKPSKSFFWVDPDESEFDYVD